MSSFDGWQLHQRSGPFDWYMACRQHREPQDGCMSCKCAATMNVSMARELHRETGGCNCVSAVVPIPEHMASYRAARVADGLSDRICIDPCLLKEIQWLWEQGIRTTGCCCGHGKPVGFIGVYDEDIPRMKAMGYEVAFNPMRPGDEDSFKPKGGTMITQEQARALLEAHDIWALLDNEQEIAELAEHNPELLEAYYWLHRIASGGTTTSHGEDTADHA